MQEAQFEDCEKDKKVQASFLSEANKSMALMELGFALRFGRFIDLQTPTTHQFKFCRIVSSPLVGSPVRGAWCSIDVEDILKGIKRSLNYEYAGYKTHWLEYK